MNLTVDMCLKFFSFLLKEPQIVSSNCQSNKLNPNINDVDYVDDIDICSNCDVVCSKCGISIGRGVIGRYGDLSYCEFHYNIYFKRSIREQK